MAPDRRFGLPHPFDVETSEASSRRKPGFWESLRRALADPPVEPAPRSPASPETIPRADTDSAPVPASAVPRGADGPPIAEEVPFLSDPPAPAPAATRPAADAQEPPPLEPSHRAPSEETPAGRLARGLASFSRENAQREKKFGHLLRDSPTEKRPSGSRKRD